MPAKDINGYARAYYQRHRDRMVQRKAELRRETRRWLAELKVGRGCADCGYNAHHAALDFDHVRETKSFGIGGGASGDHSRRALEAEIAKCDVVCANCHRIRTYERHHAKAAA